MNPLAISIPIATAQWPSSKYTVRVFTQFSTLLLPSDTPPFIPSFVPVQPDCAWAINPWAWETASAEETFSYQCQLTHF